MTGRRARRAARPVHPGTLRPVPGPALPGHMPGPGCLASGCRGPHDSPLPRRWPLLLLLPTLAIGVAGGRLGVFWPGLAVVLAVAAVLTVRDARRRG